MVVCRAVGSFRLGVVMRCPLNVARTRTGSGSERYGKSGSKRRGGGRGPLTDGGGGEVTVGRCVN